MVQDSHGSLRCVIEQDTLSVPKVLFWFNPGTQEIVST